MGHNSRGEHWLRWAEASAADVVVLGATAHVCAPRRRTPVPTDAPPPPHPYPPTPRPPSLPCSPPTARPATLCLCSSPLSAHPFPTHYPPLTHPLPTPYLPLTHPLPAPHSPVWRGAVHRRRRQLQQSPARGGTRRKREVAPAAHMGDQHARRLRPAATREAAAAHASARAPFPVGRVSSA